MRSPRLESPSDEQTPREQAAGLVPSEPAIDALDQEDFSKPELVQRKRPIVSVHGQDVDEKDLGKAA